MFNNNLKINNNCYTIITMKDMLKYLFFGAFAGVNIFLLSLQFLDTNFFFKYSFHAIINIIPDKIYGMETIGFMIIVFAVMLLTFSIITKQFALTLLYILSVYVSTAFYLISQDDIFQFLGFCILFSYLGAILVLFTFFIMMVYPRIKDFEAKWT